MKKKRRKHIKITGDIEKYGTGFKRLKDWFRFYPNITLDIEDLNDFIRIRILSKKLEPINEGVNLLYQLIRNYPHKRTPFFVEQLGTSVKNIERWIKELKEQNKIEFRGTSKTGGYFVK